MPPPKGPARHRGPRRRRGPHAQAEQPRQGALPADRDHQGRGAQLLRPHRTGAAAAPDGPRGHPGPVAARHARGQLLREERAGRDAVVGAHREGADHGQSRSVATRRHLRLPDRRRPRDPDLDGQPGRPRAATCTSGRWARTAGHATRTGSSSTSTPASRPASTSAPRSPSSSATSWTERGLGSTAVTSGSKGIHLYAALPGKLNPGRDLGAGQGARRGAPEGAPGAGHRDDDQGTQVGKGVPGLVAERRLQDHADAVLAARARRPTVATPLSWAEVEAGAEDPLDLEQFRFEAVLERVDDLGDLFAAALTAGGRLRHVPAARSGGSDAWRRENRRAQTTSTVPSWTPRAWVPSYLPVWSSRAASPPRPTSSRTRASSSTCPSTIPSGVPTSTRPRCGCRG